MPDTKHLYTQIVSYKTYLMIKGLLFILSFSTFVGMKTPNEPMNIYEIEVPALESGTIDFSAFKGKKVLIVNTASECGFTPQYAQLEELYRAHKDNLVIVGFPANNFGGQEPGSDVEIAAFCKMNYGVSFPMASKVSVKGDDQDPLFAELTKAENPDFTGDIKWNFEKFLFDENGHLVHRYRSATLPLSDEILQAIEE